MVRGLQCMRRMVTAKFQWREGARSGGGMIANFEIAQLRSRREVRP